MKKRVKVPFRTIVLGFIYLFNSMVAYIPAVYNTVYDYYDYIGAVLLSLAVLSVFNFQFSRKILVMSLFSVMLAFISIQVNQFPIGDFFPLVWLVTLFCCFRQLEFRELQSPIFNCVNIAFWCYLMAYSVVYHSTFDAAIHLEGATISGMLNPNTVGLGIAQYALLWGVTGLDNRGNSKKKYLIYGLSLVGIYLSYSRAPLVFFTAMLLMKAFIKRDRFKHMIAVKAATIAIVAGGVIFPLAYVALWKKIGSDAVFLGKNLFTGRERIWSTLFAYVERHPTALYWGTGKMREIFWHEHFNPHNSYLALFSEYGLVTSAIFWFFLLLLLFQKYAQLRVLFEREHAPRLAFGADGSNHIEMDINAVIFALFSLCVAYTETYYTYILTTIYIAYGYGAVARKGSAHDT